MEGKTLVQSLQDWLHLKKKANLEGLAEPPLPSELFNADQMERHGVTLALSHQVVTKNTRDMLLTRLAESEATLIQACDILTVNNDDSAFSPAREWLLDNFYLIQEEVQAIRRNLPKDYGRALPQLVGTQPGYPRVYDIALEIIKHGDGRWDIENLRRFIDAYQTIAPLTLGELWAIPITLGVALIENLANASKRIVADRQDRDLADSWADKMVEAAVSHPKLLVIIIADMARSNPPMSSAFVAELTRRLQGAALSLPLNWMEQHVADEGMTVEGLVQEENQYQAANQVSVSNSIASLRRLSDVDWRLFVESVSVVNQLLARDPAEIFTNMDFSTRDLYRHVVERLARESKCSEPEVAKGALLLAQQANQHVGFYLIDQGLPTLEKALICKIGLWHKFRRTIGQFSLFSYSLTILTLSLSLTSLWLYQVDNFPLGTAGFTALGLAVFIFGTQLAVFLTNLIVTLFVLPKPLPRMDFSKGIPIASRALVVVPAMLDSEARVEELLEELEVRYLGNRDPHLHFMLLTDFNDAPTEHQPQDEKLLNLASDGIALLNQRYVTTEHDIFFLLHRPRLWNDQEAVWMARERKRGKLYDLNSLLRSNQQQAFMRITGRIEILSAVKYVITLDCDTQLSRESAQLLVATMAHPLNRPVIDAATQTVQSGYGILQPRVAEAISLDGPTSYIRLFGSDFGVDPYTRTVSDVYQDIFHEGSFVGKGIYDVDVFAQVLANRFPDNQILSHDLLEGCYLHSGFLSEVPLYERSPSSYLADVKRRERWIRGDWQLLSWLTPWVRNGEGRLTRNPLSFLSRLKILDNLRRSLVPLSLLILFALDWAVFKDPFWYEFTLALVILPAVFKTSLELLRKPREMLYHQHASNIGRSFLRGGAQLLFSLTALPHEAWYSTVAILKTLWRMFISHRHLLEWVPSEQVKLKNSYTHWLAAMWAGPLVAFLGFAVLSLQPDPLLFTLASPLLYMWLFSPLIARYLSLQSAQVAPKLTTTQLRFLRRMARKTWGFFENFISEENHWLPPDNYQEAPVDILARRTSPTNIGLSLLANLTAYDFGYLNMQGLLERCQNTLATLRAMERYKGHLYNWYSTETLAPLLPRYVSTVDSGNLAGHLLTLRQGLLALLNEPLLASRYIEGLEDTWDVLEATVINSQPQASAHFNALLKGAPKAFRSWSSALTLAHDLLKTAEVLAGPSSKSELALNDLGEWSSKLTQQCIALRDELASFASVPNIKAATTLAQLAAQQNPQALARIEQISQVASECFAFAQLDFTFLYDATSHLMTIGYNVDDQRADLSDYDLLCSEVRLGNFVAIAQGQVLQESWFALGRLLVSTGGDPVLISWSGSMFEYLMPLLVMPSYAGTLLHQTYRSAVDRQIAYGKKRGVPWGISESGYNAVDNHFNYLYRAFGVPGLGLKRGLEEDLVIAPYACVMALMIAPEAACLNLQRLAKEHAVGKYGFYEAIDYTLSRLPRDTQRALVRSFMAHHQGMSFLAYSYLLHDQPMQKRFIADPQFQATLLLLQEKMPKPTASYLEIPKSLSGSAVAIKPESSMRVFNTPNTRTPQVQLISNGRYHVVLTQAGGGYSRWKDVAITRWREDSTCDNWGLFSYVRDVSTNEFWSTSFQPTLKNADSFKAVFSEAHAEFTRTDDRLDLHTEIVVSPEDDIELRRIRMHNRARVRRTFELTSYAEIVLAGQTDDQAQPAFSNLFVETEILTDQHAILATRRTQDGQESTPWLCHLLKVDGEEPLSISFETDRARFIGRGRTLAEPQAMLDRGDLSNTQGAVLDPIISIRCRITLEAGALVTFDLLTGVTHTRAHCLALVEKYQDGRLANRIFGLAWTHGQVLLHHLNITEANAQLYGRLASPVIYQSSSRRADPAIIASNTKGQSALWAYSISGDLPIILLYIEEAENIELVLQLVQAQAYWRYKGLVADLVIINSERIGYRQSLHEQIMSLITGTEHAGSIIVRNADQIPHDDQVLLQTVARVVLSDQRGSLKDQLNRRRVAPPLMPMLNAGGSASSFISKLPPMPQDLIFFNGYGGFTAQGNEYLIRLTQNQATPAPWANVLANPNFGSLVSESGQGYTWTENAHEFRLTPWENDPIKDSAGEVFYLRDDETGDLWSPTTLPCRGVGDYQIRHGFGYSVFEHSQLGIYSELTLFVAKEAPVKFFLFKLRNDSIQNRSLSLTGLMAWVLGDLRSKNAMYVVSELANSGAILAHNYYNSELGTRTAFFDADTSHLELQSRSLTADRAEFLGRNGSYAQPLAMRRKRLSGRLGASLDPCAAIQLAFTLAPGQTRELVFTLGAGQNRQEADDLAQRFNQLAVAKTELSAVKVHWQSLLGKLQIKTPDVALNLLANGWLVYQLLASRLWGRSGYYQSGGAFGFRDQLQDVLALAQVAPEYLRAQILLCASHQFEAGDVQHWWHPPFNRGVRTHCSDDYLWLPYAIAHYLEVTGDYAILDEKQPFLQGRELNPNEESYYDLATFGAETFSLYQHAVRALNHGLRFGAHGLPLIGSGDWNDGMNMVGKEGKGESVWLGFFLYSALTRFAPIAEHYKDAAFAKACQEAAATLQKNLEESAWDGAWYRRAYFDDGTPLGSSTNTECRIDSIAQSWSVLSGAAGPERATEAMASLYTNLVNPKDRIIKLLDPPFDHSNPNPGYIQGYLPGIRENGGQYTHGAVWATMALAKLGEGAKAWQLFEMLNPINHGHTAAEIAIYKIEPYVIAGDVYSVAPHTGRGGWSWYTGSAGWLYRLITETLLGMTVQDGKTLTLNPILPPEWKSLSLVYLYGSSTYTINLDCNSNTEKSQPITISLVDDHAQHQLNFKISEGSS